MKKFLIGVLKGALGTLIMACLIGSLLMWLDMAYGAGARAQRDQMSLECRTSAPAVIGYKDIYR